ncbi:hypothetical protein [Actinoplanes sp. NPDC023714]|uniref:hypothetical protein n=1 Tax=Actinoplanes sp. NPDC023714 TaxID=3154322 RepID=UPI0033F6507E
MPLHANGAGRRDGSEPADSEDDAQTGGTMHGWIRRANVGPFLESIAELIRFGLDLDAATAGLNDSDADENRWLTVVMAGEQRVELHLAAAEEEAVLVDVELEGLDDALQLRIALLTDLCCSYILTPAE